MRIFPVFLACLFTAGVTVSWRPNTQQAVLTGKVSDKNSGEALIGATVKVLKGTDLQRGAVTDIEGAYRVSLEPGLYTVQFSYTGFASGTVTDVLVRAGQLAVLDMALESTSVLDEVIVTAYKVPLIQQDATSTGQTLTSEQIRNLPTRNVQANKAAGAGSNPNAASIKGKRSEATTYYIDGIRVGAPAGKSAAPTSAKAGKKSSRRLRSDSTMPAPGEQDSITPDYSAENYAHIQENPFLPAGDNPVSTFSIDVDVASYANIRRFLHEGTMPPPDAVRIEEMINYFDYAYAPPTDQYPFAVHTEMAPCPWAPEHRLLLVGLQGRQIETGQLPPSNFVFLIDVSGSMSDDNKLPLVQQSLRLLVQQLRPQDRVALVVYAGAAGTVLPSTSGSDKAAINAAIDRLSAGGSTAGAAGIQLAYQVARSHYAERGNNRVILCTDGDFNVGVSSDAELVRLIEKERESGVFLSVLGFGMGNYQDAKMQQLADKGNGNHAYIDQIGEARKVLVSEFGGTLFAIAKDVKLQLEFNPARVAGYRLIGYENRLLAREDFDDDAKDAGELGVGHRVTALYEVVPVGKPLPLAKGAGPLKYQTIQPTAAAQSSELCTLKLRYKQPKPNATSTLLETVVKDAPQTSMSENLQLAAATASFGMLLRGSQYKGAATYGSALALARQSAKHDPNGYRTELCSMIEKAQFLTDPLRTGK